MHGKTYCWVMRSELLHAELTHSVIGAFFEAYNTLGYGYPGFLYSRALARELVGRGHQVGREVTVTVDYKGEVLGQLRLDMVVDEKLIVEIKATDNLHRDASRQLLSYLRATRMEVGLLLHFSPSGARYFRLACSNNPEASAKSAKSARL